MAGFEKGQSPSGSLHCTAARRTSEYELNPLSPCADEPLQDAIFKFLGRLRLILLLIYHTVKMLNVSFFTFFNKKEKKRRKEGNKMIFQHFDCCRDRGLVPMSKFKTG
jgi:hypothetical protein